MERAFTHLIFSEPFLGGGVSSGTRLGARAENCAVCGYFFFPEELSPEIWAVFRTVLGDHLRAELAEAPLVSKDAGPVQAETPQRSHPPSTFLTVASAETYKSELECRKNLKLRTQNVRPCPKRPLCVC